MELHARLRGSAPPGFSATPPGFSAKQRPRRVKQTVGVRGLKLTCLLKQPLVVMDAMALSVRTLSMFVHMRAKKQRQF